MRESADFRKHQGYHVLSSAALSNGDNRNFVHMKVMVDAGYPLHSRFAKTVCGGGLFSSKEDPQNGMAHIGLADDVTSAGARIGPKGGGLEFFFWGGCGWRPHICRAPVPTGARSAAGQRHAETSPGSCESLMRWWFVCPRLRRRVRKLYLPLGARHFWSRRAYRLAYASQRGTAPRVPVPKRTACSGVSMSGPRLDLPAGRVWNFMRALTPETTACGSMQWTNSRCLCCRRVSLTSNCRSRSWKGPSDAQPATSSLSPYWLYASRAAA